MTFLRLSFPLTHAHRVTVVVCVFIVRTIQSILLENSEYLAFDSIPFLVSPDVPQ